MAFPNNSQFPSCIAFSASSNCTFACSGSEPELETPTATPVVAGCADAFAVSGCRFPNSAVSASSSVGSITTLSPAIAMTRLSCGKFVPSACRYSGTMYKNEFSIGVTICFPRITRDPCWFQRVSCCEMVVF